MFLLFALLLACLSLLLRGAACYCVLLCRCLFLCVGAYCGAVASLPSLCLLLYYLLFSSRLFSSLVLSCLVLSLPYLVLSCLLFVSSWGSCGVILGRLGAFQGSFLVVLGRPSGSTNISDMTYLARLAGRADDINTTENRDAVRMSGQLCHTSGF